MNCPDAWSFYINTAISSTQKQCLEFCPRGMQPNNRYCEKMSVIEVSPNKALCDIMFAGHIINMSVRCDFAYKLDSTADYYFFGFPLDTTTFFLFG